MASMVAATDFSRQKRDGTMSIEQLRQDIEASLQRTALILNEDKMQRQQHLLYPDQISYHPNLMEKPPKPPSKSGTFNTVRLKKYFGIGSKKNNKSIEQLSQQYHPSVGAYPDVVQAQYQPRYPEGWMYTTVTSKTVHTVYAAMSMRGAAPRERPAMYAWDGYPPTAMNVDARYPDMCICHRPSASVNTWSRRPPRVQCTCCESSTSPTSVRRGESGHGNKKWSAGSSSKFSTMSSASSKSGAKRKSILESGVTAYDLIAKSSEASKKTVGSLDDSLIDDFLDESEEKEKIEEMKKMNENQKKAVNTKNKVDLKANNKATMFIKNQSKTNQVKNENSLIKPKPITHSNQKAIVEDWDHYHVDSKEMRISGQRMIITNFNNNNSSNNSSSSSTTNTDSIRSRKDYSVPSTNPFRQSSLAKATSDQLQCNPQLKPDMGNSQQWKIMPPCKQVDKYNSLRQAFKTRFSSNRKALSPPPSRKEIVNTGKTSVMIKVGGSPPPLQRSPLVSRKESHLSRDVLFEEDENAADDEESPVTPRSLSRSTPNLSSVPCSGVRKTNPPVFVVKPILKKASSVDTSSETDSDLYGSEATSMSERRRKKHVHFKSRGSLFTSEPVVEEIPPLELGEFSQSDEDDDDDKEEESKETEQLQSYKSDDDDYLEPMKSPTSLEPVYVNQFKVTGCSNTQDKDIYDDCNQVEENKQDQTQYRQSTCLRRSQSERPRQRAPCDRDENNSIQHTPFRTPPTRSTSFKTSDEKQKSMKGEETKPLLIPNFEHHEASKQLDWLIKEKGTANLLPKSIKDSLRPEENLYDDTGMNSEDFGLPETGSKPVNDVNEGVMIMEEGKTEIVRSMNEKGRFSWDSARSSSVEFITNLRNRKFAIPRPPLIKSKSVPIRGASLRSVGVAGVGSGSESIYEQIGEPIYEELPDYPNYDDASTLALLPSNLVASPSIGDGPRRSIFEGASRNEILSILQDAKERGVENMEVEVSVTTGNADPIVETLNTQVLPSERNNHRIRISNVSNLSDSSHSSEESTQTEENKERRSSVEVERNDSGVGPETSKPSRLKRQSSINPGNEEWQCEDCDQILEAKSNTDNLYDDSLVCKKCAKRRAERREIITEIVETEIKYGRDLKIIRDEFSRPMAVAGLLTSEQLANIFLNIDELIDINNKFTEKLRDASDIAVEQGDDDFTTVHIGKLFLESTNMLKAFESYCIGQGQACLLLSSLEKEKELLRIFLRVSQMENTLLRRMNLNSFLMVPVQRVTKYPLLLNRLIKVTCYQHKDHDLIREAQQKIELHLEQINQQAKDISGAKIWRRISHISSTYNKRIPVADQESGGNIKLRKMALEVLDWNCDEVRFVCEGRLFFTHQTDHLWNRRSRTLKLTPVYALLVTLGKPNANYRPDKAEIDDLLFPRNTGIREASLVLVKEKNNRQSLVRNPVYLQTCVISSDCESEDMFEIQDFVNKEAFLFKAEDVKGTQDWLRQLRYHAKDLGSWRRRRNAMANIMINGMFRQ